MTFRSRCPYHPCSWSSDPEPSTAQAVERLHVHLAYASHTTLVNPAAHAEPDPIVEELP